jgi:hypothetical protein
MSLASSISDATIWSVTFDHHLLLQTFIVLATVLETSMQNHTVSRFLSVSAMMSI